MNDVVAADPETEIEAEDQKYTPRWITEQNVDSAVGFLRDNAHAIGLAKERSVRAGHMIKHIKALRQKMVDGPVNRGEVEAYASDEYLAAIEEDAIAAGELAKLTSLRQAAEMTISAWQSQQATLRAIKV